MGKVSANERQRYIVLVQRNILARINRGLPLASKSSIRFTIVDATGNSDLI